MTVAQFSEYRDRLLSSPGWHISAKFDNDSGKWKVKVYAPGNPDAAIDCFDVDYGALQDVVNSLAADTDAVAEEGIPVVLDPFKGTRFILDEDNVLA